MRISQLSNAQATRIMMEAGLMSSEYSMALAMEVAAACEDFPENCKEQLLMILGRADQGRNGSELEQVYGAEEARKVVQFFQSRGVTVY